MSELETQISSRQQTTPAQWAVALITVLASWQVGQHVARWLLGAVAPHVSWAFEPFGTGPFSDVVRQSLHAVVAALVAAPLAYAVVQLLTRRR